VKMTAGGRVRRSSRSPQLPRLQLRVLEFRDGPGKGNGRQLGDAGDIRCVYYNNNPGLFFPSEKSRLDIKTNANAGLWVYGYRTWNDKADFGHLDSSEIFQDGSGSTYYPNTILVLHGEIRPVYNAVVGGAGPVVPLYIGFNTAAGAPTMH